MNLIKRFPYANIYGDERHQRDVEGGIPNVPIDINGNLEPLDNELEIVTTHPQVKYLVKRGPFSIGFHNKNSNKYLVGVQLRTGETMKVTLPNEAAVTPTVKADKRTLEWNYSWGWTRIYAIEKELKEVVKQNAGKEIKYRYVLNGLDGQSIGDDWVLKRTNGQTAFRVPKPYYIKNVGGEWEFDGYVPYTKQKINANTWELTYPAPSSNKYIDPIIVFGEGAGMVGGDHKDTWINASSVASAYGTRADLNIRFGGIGLISTLMRFSLINHIPLNAIINTSILSMRVTVQTTLNVTVGIHSLLTDWGVTPIVEGVNENPATGGQATWRRSIDFNGVGGDVLWNGGNFGVGDFIAAELVHVFLAADVVGTWYNFSIPIMTGNWIQNDANNYGLCFYPTVGGNAIVRLGSQEAVVPANRPYLTVDYDLPPSGQVSRVIQSHMGIYLGLGIS